MGKKGILVALSALAVTLAGGALAQTHEGEKGMPGHVMVTPEQVQWSDAPSIGPGVKIAVLEGTMKDDSPFTALIKFPADFKVPVHTHPVMERVTVLSGNFYLGIGDEFDRARAETLTPGSVALMPPGVAMFAYTEGEESVIQLHGTGPWGITYLNPDESPAVKK
ncbi:cupin domain-containing protein [Desulfuromonas sp. TF]|uniref:cupin domain-containing protein n=1 Tax=Desulfuromonas sp. TF TaxID=1232410 RepID=UPI0003F55967|nr:cupin domain-containing protein [Desulfuromonas sp. TF]